MSQDKSDGWSKRARIGLLVLGILLGAVAAPMIYAQVTTTEDYHMGEGMVIGSPSGLEVELGQNLTNDRQHLSPSNDAIDLRPVRLEADGDARATISGWDSEHLVLADLDASSNELRVRPIDQSDIDIDGAATRVEIGSVGVDDGTDDVRVTTTGSTSLTVWGLPADETVVAIDGDSGDRIETVTTDGEGSATVTVSQDRDIRFVGADAPTISNVQPADGATIDSYTATLSAEIDDPDFGETWGDSATVTFEEVDTGATIDSTTITSAQTVTAEWSGLDMGANEWRVVVEDGDGNEVSDGTNTVYAPDELEIRDEETQDLITGAGANVTVRFFGASGEVSVSRSTDDGVLNLTGLPSDQMLFVQANADGYNTRTTVIESIVEQQSAYLVDENTTVTENTFVLDDQTGQFQSADSVLLIEGLVETGNGTEEYRTVAGDEFGADARVETRLITDERYQVSVLNQDGDRRSLGSYTASSSGPVTLSVGEVEWGTPDEDGYTFTASKISGGDEIEVQFNSTEPAAEELTVRVVERYDDSAVVYENTVTDTDQWRVTVPLNESQQGEAYRVEYTLTRGGETTQGSTLVSGDTSVSTSLPSEWMTAFAMIAIVIVSALFTGRMSSFGGIATVGVAGLLMILGWAPIPTYAWFVAGFIAVGGYVRAHEGATP